MIAISTSAAEGLKQLLKERGSDIESAGLRLAISKGGCAGLQYDMSVAEAEEDDIIVEAQGVRVFIDPSSQQHFEGCSLDYVDDLAGSGFRIVNPKAVRSCGCGTSFEPAAN